MKMQIELFKKFFNFLILISLLCIIHFRGDSGKTNASPLPSASPDEFSRVSIDRGFGRDPWNNSGQQYRKSAEDPGTKMADN
ncbi:hypothetical protein Anas_02151 [Armadillidium nasatum]|uniref:Uncharacterized protein n=1 Tax=Armadillidium nasatum TaxID=96803 RepID=A0A5N5SYZ7_9CRUS|nr:hypothetical protein Anas_02151 [Armadillidium nasatum]